MTEKSSEGGTFPENRHNPVFEVIRQENLQKGGTPENGQKRQAKKLKS